MYDASRAEQLLRREGCEFPALIGDDAMAPPVGRGGGEEVSDGVDRGVLRPEQVGLCPARVAIDDGQIISTATVAWRRDGAAEIEVENLHGQLGARGWSRVDRRPLLLFTDARVALVERLSREAEAEPFG